MDPLYGPVISSYTRADALEDGTLIDVTETAHEMGYMIPVAVTCAVWAEVIEPDDTPGQSVEGRLWDVLWMLYNRIRVSSKRGEKESNTMKFSVLALTEGKEEMFNLYGVVGPGDDPKPVLTILMQGED